MCSYASDGPDGLALAAFERSVRSLRLPSQQFTFTTKHLATHEDAPLAMAYAMSIRHTRVQSLRLDGTIDIGERMYLDSRELVAALRRAAPSPSPVAAGGGVATSRTIPIFFFSTDSRQPLFVDTWHTARAVEGMVLAVQSDYAEHESSFVCGGKHRLRNLRRPHREALAATAMLIAGLAPTHVLRQPSQRHTSENWLWVRAAGRHRSSLPCCSCLTSA